MNQAHDHQPINGLDRVDGVATGDGNARRCTGRTTAIQNAANGLRAQDTHRHAHQRQRHDRPAAHGIDITDGIGGSNSSKVEWVIDDGHEEVGGGNQGLLIVEQIDRCIIGRVDPHQELGRHRQACAALENLGEHAGCNLAATAAAVREGCQSGFSHGVGASWSAKRVRRVTTPDGLRKSTLDGLQPLQQRQQRLRLRLVVGESVAGRIAGKLQGLTIRRAREPTL